MNSRATWTPVAPLMTTRPNRTCRCGADLGADRYGCASCADRVADDLNRILAADSALREDVVDGADRSGRRYAAQAMPGGEPLAATSRVSATADDDNDHPAHVLNTILVQLGSTPRTSLFSAASSLLRLTSALAARPFFATAASSVAATADRLTTLANLDDSIGTQTTIACWEHDRLLTRVDAVDDEPVRHWCDACVNFLDDADLARSITQDRIEREDRIRFAETELEQWQTVSVTAWALQRDERGVARAAQRGEIRTEEHEGMTWYWMPDAIAWNKARRKRPTP